MTPEPPALAKNAEYLTDARAPEIYSSNYAQHQFMKINEAHTTYLLPQIVITSSEADNCKMSTQR